MTSFFSLITEQFKSITETLSKAFKKKGTNFEGSEVEALILK